MQEKMMYFPKKLSRVIHSFKMYLFSTYVAGTLVGTWGPSINKTDKDWNLSDISEKTVPRLWQETE